MFFLFLHLGASVSPPLVSIISIIFGSQLLSLPSFLAAVGPKELVERRCLVGPP